jgi:regulator of sirC expression with transglutaminase-like and TPR domain
MKNEKEIMALINLLDDPSEDVYRMVEENLLQQGPGIIPALESAWENSPDKFHQERLEDMIHQLQFNNTEMHFSRWINEGAIDLLEGTYLVARFQFPELTFSEINDHVDQIKQDVWIELNDNLTALEKVRIMNHIIFKIHGFRDNASNFYDPGNSYINKVLELKKGNPISLGILYSTIGQRLGLPIYGINLPKNYILGYKDSSDLYETSDEDILFYINPFKGGAVLGRKEIDYFLNQHGIEPQKEFYIPCSNLDIIARVLNNLLNSYKRQKNQSKIEHIRKIIRLLPGG